MIPDSLEKARKSLLDEYMDHPYRPFEFLTEMRRPEPTNHSDSRMHLELRDMKHLFGGKSEA